MPPTGFPHCDYIECGYFIHAVAKTNRLYDDIVVKLPIIIQHGDQEDWDQDQKQKEPNEEDKVKETVNDDIVTVDDGNISPHFENIGDEVDVEATPLDETDQDEQTLPGQVEEITEEKDEEEELGDNVDDTETSDDTKDLLDDDDGMD
eukprot:TRINITY_DN27433_c0_g1_i1.p1 TRINITY_DN27433_c0_g1~~TRINITY_DN27433_c0_g1_i1.p1  ORF type:complete len:167 (-),score=73.50 TRINITY_DN27433_c0_g1_i1:146-589(-)